MWFLTLLFAAAFAQPRWCSPTDYGNSSLPDGFCARLWARGINSPRGIWTATNGDLLVVEAGTGSILALFDANKDGFSDASERVTLARVSGLNHGITVFGDYLYATSQSTLYRWRYVAAERKVGPIETVIRDMPTGGHSTRTPRFDKDGLLYLSVGSAGNVDSNSIRSRVNRFDLTRNSFPIPWSAGYVYADGLRNEVGLNFDKEGRLWGVMNGMDNLNRADLGGDIHNTNPAEELNDLSTAGKFYGYPYCWAEYILPTHGKGAGTMWAHENFIRDGTHTDAWCQNPNNVVRPSLALSAHTAPLDVFFWYGDSFGAEYKGDAFVALHGSWNRNPPAGYRVVRVKFENGVAKQEIPFLWHNGASERWGNNFRPVGLAWTPKNCENQDCLYVSSDASGEIVFIRKVQ